MDKRSVWVLCGVFLYFSSCIRLFSVYSIDLEVSPLVDQFSKYDFKFLLYWVVITLVAKVVGARMFGKLADQQNILYAMRACAAFHIIAATFMVMCFVAHLWFFNPSNFFYMVRAAHSFVEPAMLILSAIFLIKINKKISAVYISAIVNVVAGSGIISAYLLSNLISIYKISNWYLFLFAISAVGFCCFLKGTNKSNHDQSLIVNIRFAKTRQEKFFAFSLGACCLAAISHISFCFDRFIHDKLVIEDSLRHLNSAYFYALLLVACAPSAFIASWMGIDKTSKIGIIGSIVTAIMVYLLPFNQNFLIVVGSINTLFISLFFVSNCALLHESYGKTHQYKSAIFWFTLGFAVFGAHNAFSQVLHLWPLHITGIVTAIPGMLMHLVYLYKIGYKRLPNCFLSATTLDYTFGFRHRYVPEKTNSNVSLVCKTC